MSIDGGKKCALARGRVKAWRMEDRRWRTEGVAGGSRLCARRISVQSGKRKAGKRKQRGAAFWLNWSRGMGEAPGAGDALGGLGAPRAPGFPRGAENRNPCPGSNPVTHVLAPCPPRAVFRASRKTSSAPGRIERWCQATHALQRNAKRVPPHAMAAVPPRFKPVQYK